MVLLMRNTAEYVQILLDNCRLDRWNLLSIRSGSASTQRDKLKGTLSFFNAMDKFDQLESQLLSAAPESPFSDGIQNVAVQLKEDLIDYLAPTHHAEYQKTQMVFLPLPAFDGFCIDRDQQGRQLDGYVICLNEGLWVCAQLLAKAFVLENLQGDLSQYKASGKSSHDAALAHFLAPSSHYAKHIFFDTFPAEIEGLAAAAQSSMAVLILQFVSLHELGHIIHKDFALMGAYRFHFGAFETKSEPSPHAMTDQVTDQYWQAEYAADVFALEMLCQHAQQDINRWANFISIDVFFSWLIAVEQRLGKEICPYHPPPDKRREKLAVWMHENYPPNPQILTHLDDTQRILQSWNPHHTESTP